MAGKDVIANRKAVIIRKRALAGFIDNPFNKKSKVIDDHLFTLAIKEIKKPSEPPNPWGVFKNKETFVDMHLA